MCKAVDQQPNSRYVITSCSVSHPATDCSTQLRQYLAASSCDDTHRFGPDVYTRESYAEYVPRRRFYRAIHHRYGKRRLGLDAYTCESYAASHHRRHFYRTISHRHGIHMSHRSRWSTPVPPRRSAVTILRKNLQVNILLTSIQVNASPP